MSDLVEGRSVAKSSRINSTIFFFDLAMVKKSNVSMRLVTQPFFLTKCSKVKHKTILSADESNNGRAMGASQNALEFDHLVKRVHFKLTFWSKIKRKELV